MSSKKRKVEIEIDDTKPLHGVLYPCSFNTSHKLCIDPKDAVTSRKMLLKTLQPWFTETGIPYDVTKLIDDGKWISPSLKLPAADEKQPSANFYDQEICASLVILSRDENFKRKILLPRYSELESMLHVFSAVVTTKNLMQGEQLVYQRSQTLKQVEVAVNSLETAIRDRVYKHLGFNLSEAEFDQATRYRTGLHFVRMAPLPLHHFCSSSESKDTTLITGVFVFIDDSGFIWKNAKAGKFETLEEDPQTEEARKNLELFGSLKSVDFRSVPEEDNLEELLIQIRACYRDVVEIALNFANGKDPMFPVF